MFLIKRIIVMWHRLVQALHRNFRLLCFRIILYCAYFSKICEKIATKNLASTLFGKLDIAQQNILLSQHG